MASANSITRKAQAPGPAAARRSARARRHARLRKNVALYYRLAPAMLAALPEAERRDRLLSLYLRFILPCALAARFGLNRFAHHRYARMMAELSGEFSAHA